MKESLYKNSKKISSPNKVYFNFFEAWFPTPKKDKPMKYLIIATFIILGVAAFVNSQLVIDSCKPQDCKY